MYKCRALKKKGFQYQIENLRTKEKSVVTQGELEEYVKAGTVTNVVFKDGELLVVKDALESYIKLRDQIWECSSLSALVSSKTMKKTTIHRMRFFDGYGADITALLFDFLYIELDLNVDEAGNILYISQGLDPVGDFKDAINKKCNDIQKELVPEKAEMVTSITEVLISKALKRAILSWDYSEE